MHPKYNGVPKRAKIGSWENQQKINFLYVKHRYKQYINVHSLSVVLKFHGEGG